MSAAENLISPPAVKINRLKSEDPLGPTFKHDVAMTSVNLEVLAVVRHVNLKIV
jgi:hypothetical protein